MIRIREIWQNVKVGAKFHQLTVIGQQFRLHTGKPKPAWACVVQCTCGTFKVVYAADLVRGFQKSCGCHRLYVLRVLGRRTTHGESKTPLHNLWHLIKLRCTDPNQKSYPNYGGRGISVHPEWSESYESFRDYVRDRGYLQGLTRSISSLEEENPC